MSSLPPFQAGLFHSFRSGFCQEYQPEILVGWEREKLLFQPVNLSAYTEGVAEGIAWFISK